jgi:hypothetical protein
VNYDLGKGFIIIDIGEGIFVDSVEFYEGFFIEGDANWKDPVDRFLGSVSLSNKGCNLGSDFCITEPIYFNDIDRVDMYEEGEYYFVVRDNDQNPIRVNFYLSFKDLLSCSSNGVAVRHNECVYDQTQSMGDKPLYCRNQEVSNNCFSCGCPNPDNPKEICCTNENVAECRGNLGACVILGEEKFERNITVEEEVRGETALTVIEELGCEIRTEDSRYNVGDNVCMNSVFGLYLDDFFSIENPENHDLFASQCECTFIESNEFDADGDGYDAKNFKGGSDCNDNNATINPGARESCEDSTGYDGVDNNCDGIIDLRCDSYCDQDEDDYTTHAVCVLMGKGLGDCDDSNANINPGIVESCGNDYGFDGIDNDCNPNTAQPNCECRDGNIKEGSGICKVGKLICQGGRWVDNPVDPPVNPISNVRIENQPSECKPVVKVHGYEALAEVEVPVGKVIKIKNKFICPDDNCGKVDVRLTKI